jgi:hypothetical protein
MESSKLPAQDVYLLRHGRVDDVLDAGALLYIPPSKSTSCLTELLVAHEDIFGLMFAFTLSKSSARVNLDSAVRFRCVYG